MIRKILTLVLVASLIFSTPAVALSGSFFGGESPAESMETVKFGAEGHPSFVVEFDDGEADQLEDWADASDDRTLVRIDNDTGRAVVAAPQVEVAASLFERISAGVWSSDMLTDRDYVESVSPNWRHSTTEPVTLRSDDEIADPTLPITVRAQRLGKDFPRDGMAFSEDASETTPAEWRAALGADNLSADADGSGITVAVIDTGVNVDGRVFGNGSANSSLRVDNASRNFITGESVNVSADDYSAIEDGNGHGTWVASSVAANVTGTEMDGMAPDATVMGLKALDDEGSGSTDNIVRAIRHAADNDADIITMSLGSPVFDEQLANAVSYAFDNGVKAITVASGNSRQTVRWVASPGDVEGVITVGASTGNASDNASSAYFSQIGPDPSTTDLSGMESQGAGVDVSAPGMKTKAKVVSTSGTLSNSTLSGTSMATPMVAGGIAAAMSSNSTLAEMSHEDIHEAVQESARPAPNMAVAETGHGLFAADNLADGTEPDESQSEAMDDDASERDDVYQAMSDAAGGWIPAAAIRTPAGV